MAEEVTIIVSRDGKSVQVEGHGFVGGQCKELTQGIERALGVVTKEELKPEYHEVEEEHRHR